MSITDLLAVAHKRNPGTTPFGRTDTEAVILFCVGQDVRTVGAFMADMNKRLIGIRPMIGVYNGKAERSFVARYADLPHIIPWMLDEQTYLHVERNGKSSLHHIATDTEADLGKLRTVTREVAEMASGYTYDPEFGSYLAAW